MSTKREKKTILASPEIIRMLPPLKGLAEAEPEESAVDLLRIGSLFEMPVRSPFMIDRRFRFLPRRVVRWVRFVYGMLVLLNEKFDANRKTAYFHLLENIWMERTKQKRENQP
jgi:hypothetical protein